MADSFTRSYILSSDPETAACLDAIRDAVQGLLVCQAAGNCTLTGLQDLLGALVPLPVTPDGMVRVSAQRNGPDYLGDSAPSYF